MLWYSGFRRINLKQSDGIDKTDVHGSSRPIKDTQTRTDADYERLVSAPVQQLPYSPSPWIYSLDASTCLESLPLHLRQDPLNAIEESGGHLGLETVGKCLEAYIVLQHSQRASHQEAQQVFLDTKAGTRALVWLLRPETVDRYDIATHPRFTRTLVHLLRAEKSTEHLWHWLSIDHTPAILTGDTHKPRLWKSMVFRDLVESEVFWAQDPNPMTAGLKTYIRGLDQSKRTGISTGNAGNWLMNRLSACDNSGLNDALFEGFIKRIRWHTDHIFHTAILHLTHPSRPSAVRSLALLRASGDDHPARSEFLKELLRPKDSRMKLKLYFWLVRTAQILHKNGDVQDARWVVDLARQRVPHLLRTPPPAQHGGARPFAATRKPVDSNGASLETERMREVRLAVENLRKEET